MHHLSKVVLNNWSIWTEAVLFNDLVDDIRENAGKDHLNAIVSLYSDFSVLVLRIDFA